MEGSTTPPPIPYTLDRSLDSTVRGLAWLTEQAILATGDKESFEDVRWSDDFESVLTALEGNFREQWPAELSPARTRIPGVGSGARFLRLVVAVTSKLSDDFRGVSWLWHRPLRTVCAYCGQTAREVAPEPIAPFRRGLERLSRALQEVISLLPPSRTNQLVTKAVLLALIGIAAVIFYGLPVLAPGSFEGLEIGCVFAALAGIAAAFGR